MTAENPNFAEDVHNSFLKQNAMRLIKASMPVIEHGRTEIHLPHWEGLEQQHGYIHGGVVGMIADSAAGYAAMSVTPANTSVLTVEFKINIMTPASGNKLIACGEVLRQGKTIIVTKAEVFNETDGKRTPCAIMQQTIMVLRNRSEK